MKAYFVRSLAMALFVAVFPVHAYGWMCRYVKAISGDTLIVNCAGDELVVRLYGIDAPDIGSVNHEKSRKFLDELMKAKNTYVIGRSTMKGDFDEYGRHVAVVDKDGICINEKIVEAGMAFVYPEKCTFEVCRKWEDLQQSAQEESKGIWFLPEEKPWVLRQGKSYLAGPWSGFFEDIYYVRYKENTKSGKRAHKIVAKANDTEIPKDRYYFTPQKPPSVVINKLIIN